VRPFRWSLGAAAVLVAGAITWWVVLGRRVPLDGPVRAEIAPDSSPSPAYLLDSLTLTPAAGRPVRCALRTPTGPGSRRPAVLLSGGIRTGRRAALLVPASYQGIVLSCDYPWPDPTRRPVRDLLLRFPATRAQILATPRALALAGAYLASRSDVDPGRIAALGVSLGVPPVAAWAATDSVPRAVALVYGGADLRLVLARNMERQVRPGWLRGLLARIGAHALGPLDPLRTVGRISPRPLLVVGSNDDQRIPREAVVALHAAAGEPKQLLWMAGRHVHPSDAELLAALADSTTHWLATVLP
jgi:hypothetical protein